MIEAHFRHTRSAGEKNLRCYYRQSLLIVKDGRSEKMNNRLNQKIKTCWYCGTKGYQERSFGETYYENRYFHNDCFDKYESEKESNLKKYVELKTKVMHERALRMLEKQKVDLENYYDESDAVLEKSLEEPGKFLSSAEMVAAMELLRNRVRFKKEHQVGNHRVDFLIPSLKVVLEIDGKLHGFQKIKDTKRDGTILNVLNENDKGWEVVRIPTKYIEQNVKQLLKAIVEMKKHKQELRRKNGGFIPTYFSRRDKQYHEEL